MDDKEEQMMANMAQASAVFEGLVSTPAMLAHLQAQAKLRRMRYETLVEAGFTAGQALYLCRE